jgi:ABC-2 type transport system permease protein/lipopolysaccharide transport system permease protein
VGSLPLIAIVSLAINHNVLHLVVLLVPLVSLAMLSVGVGLFVSASCVYFRDVPYLYELATFFLWVTSPVFYPAEIVPQTILRIIAWNPLFSIITSARTLVLTPFYPPAASLGLSVASSLLVLIAGALAFRVMRRQFMDLL